MNACEAIRQSIETADMISKLYLDDMSEEEMMHRPHEKANHIKWQLGHLIISDNDMVNGCCPGAVPELPAGFREKYTKETSGSNNNADFDSKADLMEMFTKQREATFTKLGQLSESDLDSEAPESMRAYAANTGAAFGMLGIHWTMHSGQWAVIRRQLGREPVM